MNNRVSSNILCFTTYFNIFYFLFVSLIGSLLILLIFQKIVWGQEEKGTTEDEMIGWHHRLNGHGFGWTSGVDDGQGGLACCSSLGHKESDTTERLNWLTDRAILFYFLYYFSVLNFIDLCSSLYLFFCLIYVFFPLSPFFLIFFMFFIISFLLLHLWSFLFSLSLPFS